MLETTTRLDIAVGLLTRPSKHRLIDPETHEGRWVVSDPLLLQLKLAVTNSSASTAFKSSGGQPIPVSAQALDLLDNITSIVSERWWYLHHLHFGQGRETLVGRLRTWAAVARLNQALTLEACEIMEGWVREIAALLQPLRRWEIRGCCPSCEVARIESINDDGETVSRPALTLFYSGDGIPDLARCAACGEEWLGPASIARLAYALNGV